MFQSFVFGNIEGQPYSDTGLYFIIFSLDSYCLPSQTLYIIFKRLHTSKILSFAILFESIAKRCETLSFIFMDILYKSCESYQGFSKLCILYLLFSRHLKKRRQ